MKKHSKRSLQIVDIAREPLERFLISPPLPKEQAYPMNGSLFIGAR
ncbi:hypothetical protein RE628_16005 [Paenibacillus sp. D2_2]|nr:hypothetical protein [Paenibacillus sp. D2_2]WMT39025.1 hypothetical protein RE628_16005 [Paenibacillus sp. D2_2]